MKIEKHVSLKRNALSQMICNIETEHQYRPVQRHPQQEVQINSNEGETELLDTSKSINVWHCYTSNPVDYGQIYLYVQVASVVIQNRAQVQQQEQECMSTKQLPIEMRQIGPARPQCRLEGEIEARAHSAQVRQVGGNTLLNRARQQATIKPGVEVDRSTSLLRVWVKVRTSEWYRDRQETQLQPSELR